MRRFSRFACIDWSGAKGERLGGIALAECGADGEAPALIRAPAGSWSRQAVLDWILACAAEGADMIVGIDFSAALPFVDAGAYFPGHADSPADARALWRLVDDHCADDPHLAATSFVHHDGIAPYFRIGTLTGERFASADRNGRLRRVERHEASGNPASCFNLVGAKQVGKSSLTGMRLLHRLDGRVAVWPFDPVPDRGPLLVEIYTSIAAVAAGRPRAAAKMRSIEEMNRALNALDGSQFAGNGPIDDHSSDAIVTAAWLRRNVHRDELWKPKGLHQPVGVAQTEGWTFGVP